MSNTEPENPGQSPISQTSAGRISTPSRSYSTASLADLATILSQMAAINDRIRINTENMATFLQEHQKDMNMARTAAGAGARMPGGSPSDNLLTSSDLRSPRLREQYKAERKKLLDDLQKLDDQAQREQLQKLGVRGSLIPGNPLGALRGPLSQEQGMVGAGIEDALTRSVLRNADPAAIKEAMNLRRLQELNLRQRLTPSGLMQSIGGMFGVTPGMGAHHPIDPLQAARESQQRARALEQGKDFRPNMGIGDRAADLLGSAAMRGGIGGGIASLALRSFTPLAAAIAIPEILRHFGIPIPSLTQTPAAVRGAILSGQLTGQGFTAGVGATLDARRIRSGGLLFAGLNPFDPITNEIANQIVTSVRTAGFTGDRARSLYQSVASVYRDLGLSIDTTTKIIADATRVGGESLKQISNELHGFDDAARSLSMNINTYAESVMTVSGTLRSAGGGVQSTRVAQALIAGAPRILRDGGGLSQYQQVYQNAQPFLAAQLGIPVQYLGLSGNLPHTIDAFQSQILSEIGRMPGSTLQEKAANASRFGILFKGMDVPNILGLVQQIQSGRGPSTTLQMEQIRGRLNQATVRSELVPHASGYRLGPHNVTFTRQDVAIGGTALRQAQMSALQQLRPFLNNTQLGELQQKIGNQHDFQQLVQRFEGQPPRSTGRSVDINGVTISLSSGASKILRLDVNKEQVRQGTLPSNKQYTSEADRVWNLNNYVIP